MTLDEFVDAVHESVGAADREAVMGFVTAVVGEDSYVRSEDGVAECATAFSESYDGAHESVADWASFYLEESGLLGEVPEQLRGYIDFDKFGRDCGVDGSVTFVQVGFGCVHVFTGV